MAKTFKGFTNQQTHQLLKEMGFTGPAQKDEMDAFLASSPSAASKMGRYTEIAKQRVEGGPLSGMGMAEGGSTSEIDLFNRANEAKAKRENERQAKKLLDAGGEYKEVSRIIPTEQMNSLGFKPSQDRSNQILSQEQIASRDELSPPDTRTRMVDSPVDEQGRPLYRNELAVMPGLDPTVPEGSQVLKPGTPTPETSQPSVDLDAAQTAYSHAMGTLTEAQKALSGAEAPEGFDFDETTGKVATPTYEQILEEVGSFTSDNLTIIRDLKPFEFDSFKDCISAINRIAFECEALNHHPEWTNTYNILDIKLTTNQVNAVTELDFKLLEAIHKIVEVEE